jgi:hypothetical protein
MLINTFWPEFILTSPCTIVPVKVLKLQGLSACFNRLVWSSFVKNFIARPYE